MKQVVIGCVAENTPKYLTQALRLAQSVRWFGGALAHADLIICSVDGLDPAYRAHFERYGALVRIVPRFDVRHPQSNKLRFLELEEVATYEHVLLLDCDTIVVRDISGYLASGAFRAKIADMPTVPHSLFEQLFAFFGIELPPRSLHCTLRGEATIPYFNAGVLMLGRQHLKRLVPAWLDLNRRLIDNLDLLGKQRTFCEQASLSLALAATGTRFEPFGNEMNFPLHAAGDAAAFPLLQDTDPFIIHYHWLTDASGSINKSAFPLVNDRIGLFNERQAQELRQQFDNKTFWDCRYASDPALGSGAGSRGAFKAYKRELLRAVSGAGKFSTILDVGCGDMAVSEVLPAQGYRGVDVSTVVVENNRLAYPDREFLCGDFLQMDLPAADLVVCLDVLIHIDARDSYRAFVSRLVASTRGKGIVAGFEDGSTDAAGIVFFHEPVSVTLRSAGAQNMRQIGAYRNVIVYEYSKDDRGGAPPPSDTAADALARPIFIIGTMRSGTTLLASLLGASEHIVHCPFELKDVWSRAGGIAMASPKTGDTVCPPLTAADRRPGQREALRAAFSGRMKLQPNKQSGVFLNKNPHLCNKLPFVRSLFPDARFIWTHRHLPQVVASMKRLFDDVYRRQRTRHWWPIESTAGLARCWNAIHGEGGIPPEVDPARVFPGGDVVYLAEYWLESNQAASEFVRALPPDQGLIVPEEQLIAEPELELARCFGFLGLPHCREIDKRHALDSGRNQCWSAVLTGQELHALARFVDRHTPQIDALFASQATAAGYLADILSAGALAKADHPD